MSYMQKLNKKRAEPFQSQSSTTSSSVASRGISCLLPFCDTVFCPWFFIKELPLAAWGTYLGNTYVYFGFYSVLKELQLTFQSWKISHKCAKIQLLLGNYKRWWQRMLILTQQHWAAVKQLCLPELAVPTTGSSHRANAYEREPRLLYPVKSPTMSPVGIGVGIPSQTDFAIVSSFSF